MRVVNHRSCLYSPLALLAGLLLGTGCPSISAPVDSNNPNQNVTYNVGQGSSCDQISCKTGVCPEGLHCFEGNCLDVACHPACLAADGTVTIDDSEDGGGLVTPCQVSTCSGLGCTCSIGMILYTAGTPNPANSCQVCDPSQSTIAWSNIADGTSCSGGAPVCTENNTCTAGVCGGGVPTPCCNVLNGSACGAGEICYNSAYGMGLMIPNGTCGPGCAIQVPPAAAVYYPANAADALNSCASCQPAVSTTAWSPIPDGSACAQHVTGYCVTGETCQHGTCDCPTGTTLAASGACVDTRIDSDNCGAPGVVCGVNTGCFGGVCTLAGTASVLGGPGITPYASYWSATAAGSDMMVHLMGGQVNGIGLFNLHAGYNPYTDQWSWLAGLPAGGVESDAPATIAVDGNIYLMGGENFTGNNTWSYGGGWNVLADLPTALYADGIAPALNGDVYVCGGTTNGLWYGIDFCQVYNIASDSYSILPLPAAVSPVPGNGVFAWSGTFGSDGNVYMINGSNTLVVDDTATSNVWGLTIPGQVWFQAPSTNTGRDLLASATNEFGQLMAIGGSTNYWIGPLASVETWTPGTPGPWVVSSNLLFALTAFNAAESSDCRVYAQEGLDVLGNSNNYNQVYDPRRGYWVP